MTDHGGGGGRVLSQRLPVLPRYTAAVACSEFSRGVLPDALRGQARLIKGGIDTERFRPEPSVARAKHILFVGRLLPHKGVNDLIDAFRLFARPDYRLRLVGRAYDDRFYGDLQRLARDLPVDFIHDADDAQLLREYRSASVTVLPSVHRTLYGDYTAVPELMGFTLLESQACGTPVVCTDAGAMHEFLQPGQSGLVAAQNSARVPVRGVAHGHGVARGGNAVRLRPFRPHAELGICRRAAPGDVPIRPRPANRGGWRPPGAVWCSQGIGHRHRAHTNGARRSPSTV